MAKLKQQWVLHCHHDVLVEFLTEPLEERIKYIKENKSRKEQATHLRLIKVLTDKEAALMPKKTWEALEKTWEAWEACEACEAWEKAQNSKQMKEWHKKVCVPDCPWNGKTLFL